MRFYPIVALLWLSPTAAGWADTPARVSTAVIHDDTAEGRALARHVWLDKTLRKAAPSQARLIWVLGKLSPEQRKALLFRIRGGASAIVFASGTSTSGLGGLTAIPALHSAKERISISPTPAASPSLASRVVWSSSPQAGKRFRLVGGQRLLEARGSKDPLLVRHSLGQGQLWLVGLEIHDASNRDLRMWPYFNYWLYVMGCEASGRSPLRYGEWEASPVPGMGALAILLSGIGAAWLVTLFLFFRARRHARAHPEMLQQFFPKARPTDDQTPTATGLWATIGFARPLAGFLTLAAALFLLFIPFYWLTNILIPNDVQPFPQARGMWDFAWEALQVAWYLFDAGTFVAFVKYFSEFRLKDPAEAVRSAQFFVWWQILTGLVQVTLASLAAVLILPNTRYGFNSSFVILVALGQYPGFFGVVTFFFQAYQRYDYNIGLDLLSDWVLRFVLTIPFILLFRQWGADNPQYGEAFGAAIGLGVGFHVATFITFGIGVLLFRRLGLSLLPLFMVHFDLGTAKRMLWYGARVVAGKFLFRAAQTVDKVMISLLLVNYTEWLGLYGQIHTHLMFLFPIAYRFFETAMAALSESFGNGKRTLTQYYVVRFFQVGSIYAAIGASVMLALGPLFVAKVMDPQWARAAEFLIVAAIAGAFTAPAWLSDMLQKGAGRPGLFAMVLGAEQALRIGLFALLIPLFGFWGFYLAILLSIILKVFGGWTINHLVILRLRLYPYQMFIAPALAGAINYLVWYLVAGSLATADALVVTIVFFVASLSSFVSSFFVVGLLGGYDRAFAQELDQASLMTGPLKRVTRLFYHAARLGWRLSPWHDHRPVTIYEEAMEEARELQRLL